MADNPRFSMSNLKPESAGESDRYNNFQVQTSDGGQATYSIFMNHLSVYRKLNISNLVEKLELYRKNQRGYLGIAIFFSYLFIFFAMGYLQRRPYELGQAPRAVRSAIRLNKPNTKIYNEDTYWKFIDSTILPVWYNKQWNATTADGAAVSGFTTQGSNNIIGGITFFQTRRKPESCRGAPDYFMPKERDASCYAASDAFAHSDITLTDSTNDMSVTVPFMAGGYAVLIPLTSNAYDVINFYKNASWIEASTAEAHVRFISWNGNAGLITMASMKFDFTSGGELDTPFYVESIPYHPYQQGAWGTVQYVVEWCFVAFWFFMVWNLFLSWLNNVHLPHLHQPYPEQWWRPNNLMRKGWFLAHPRYIPMDTKTAKPYMVAPMLMYGVMAAGFIQWRLILGKYADLHHVVAQSNSQALFTTSDDLMEAATLANHVYRENLEPLWATVDSIYAARVNYFLTTGGATLFALLRMFQYFSFQDKLSIITGTFDDAHADLAHLFLVMVVVVLCYAFIGHTLFGDQMKGWAEFPSAIKLVFDMIFSLYKFSTVQEKYVNPLLAEMYELIFKLGVLTLLMKMLVGIIFQMYRKVSLRKVGNLSSTVAQDIVILLAATTDWSVSFCRPGYVSPRVLMAFCRSDVIKKQLTNGVIDDHDQILDLLKQAFPDNKYGGKELNFTCAHAEWIMLKYGKIRSKTRGGHKEVMTIQQKKMVKQTFDTYDHDGSGSINYHELCSAMSHMGHPLAHNTAFMTYVMNKVDKDGNGDVSFEEFLEFVADDLGMAVEEEEETFHISEGSCERSVSESQSPGPRL
jgi:hypothetical protein